MKEKNLSNLFLVFFRNVRMIFIALFLFSYSVNAQKEFKANILSTVHGKLQPFVSNDNSLEDKVIFNILDGKSNVTVTEVNWQCYINYKEVESDVNAVDVALTIYPSEEINFQGTVGVEFDFTNWSKGNYVFIPSSVYNGNRFKAVKMDWPTVVEDESDRYHDIDPIIPKHVPHLNIDEGPSKLSIKLNDASSPAIAFFSPELEKSFLILMKPNRNFDIAIEESADRNQASLTISASSKADLYLKNDSNQFPNV